MEWKWNYGQGVLTLPAAALEANASPEQLRVLLWLASDPSLFTKPAQLAKLADCDRASVGDILRFWQDADILCGGKDSDQPKPLKKTAPGKQPERKPDATAVKPVMALAHADELPNYTTEQLSGLLEKNQPLRLLVDEAQQVWGKVFNPYETQLLVGLSDYLGLDDEYILLLLAHCRRMEKRSMREVERYALRLMDDGVTNAAALEDFVRKAEARRTLQGKIRAMFGIGSRSFTGKENKMLDAWSSYGYGEDIIRRAYEITVGAINEPSLPYANSILERWHSEGLDTAAQIDAKLDAEREKKGQTPREGSFDTDDFFEAALRRSYSDSDTENKQP